MDHTGEDVAVATQVTATGPVMRASDAERAAAADRLHTALVEGRLDVAETQERLAAVDAARYRTDLAPLLADLPTAERGQPADGWSQVWQMIVDQAWMSSAAMRGEPPAPPDRRQRRAVTIALAVAALWVAAFLLAGFAVGLLG